MNPHSAGEKSAIGAICAFARGVARARQLQAK